MENISNINMDEDVILRTKRKHDGMVNANTWQHIYVSQHVAQGHLGYCYAWLDGAFCPQSVLLGRCCYKHEYPSAWADELKAKHQRKLKCMSYLWEDYDLTRDKDGFKSRNQQSSDKMSHENKYKKSVRKLSKISKELNIDTDNEDDLVTSDEDSSACNSSSSERSSGANSLDSKVQRYIEI